MNKNRILYISYDGMTDALGQAQVINYLIGLSKYGYKFDILSFEKKQKFASQKLVIKKLLDAHDIRWYPQVFHTKPPVLSKWIDKRKLFKMAEKLFKQNNYSLIHCRSYIPSEAGLYLKQKYGVKFLFDMRGFWADEKIEGHAWNMDKWFWRKIYHYYKKKEREFITRADHIMSGTQAGKLEIMKWDFYNPNVPITVIPSCADTEHFSIITPEKKANARRELNINPGTFVLSYLGSLGSWYMLDEMLDFFLELKKKKPSAIFLIITNSPHSIITEKIKERQLPATDFKIITVTFTEVPKYMYASDICISLIKPVYSKKASSPVKIGEILSMGIPVVMNNIGDCSMITYHNEKIILSDFNITEYQNMINQFDKLLQIPAVDIRNVALQMFDVKKGIALYNELYCDIFGTA